MPKKKVYKVGDKVETSLRTSNGQKKKVFGKIKNIERYYGSDNYIITEGVVEDFSVRLVK